MPARVDESTVQEARELRKQGLSYDKIGARLGIGKDTARKYASDVVPEDRECPHCGTSFTPTYATRRFCSENCRQRAHEGRTRANCIDCGAELGAGSGYPGNTTRRCPECYAERRYLAHRLRDKQIEEWWAEGVSMAEICARLGWTKGHLGMELHRLREHGYDLPYRRRPTNPRFPEQVPA